MTASAPATLARPAAPAARQAPAASHARPVAPLRAIRAEGAGAEDVRRAVVEYMGDVEAEMEGAAAWIRMTATYPEG